jgi:hypothetical protein
MLEVVVFFWKARKEKKIKKKGDNDMHQCRHLLL